MLAVRERRQAVLDRGDRVARAFDDDVDRRMRHQRLPVLADVGRAAVLQRRVEAGRAGLRVAPADPRQVPARAVGRQIGDADQVHTRRARNLRQVHRAELAGADQADADRLVLGFASLQLCVQAHVVSKSVRHGGRLCDDLVGRGLERTRRHAVLPRQVDRIVLQQAVVGQALVIGVKSRWAMYSGRLKRRMWLETAHRLR